jgi:hypothetical protein
MPNRVEQAIVRTSLPALNDINDAYAANNTASASGATNTYAAQLGARVWLDGNPGGVRYDTAIGTLYGGKYQYVKTTAGTTATYVLGRPVFWTDFENYVVTADCTAVLVGKVAGVMLNTVTKGNYGWIQTAGKATVLFKTGITATTPADGDLIVIDVGTGLADDLTQSGSPTYLILKAAIGVALAAPVSATASLVLLRHLPEVV